MIMSSRPSLRHGAALLTLCALATACGSGAGGSTTETVLNTLPSTTAKGGATGSTTTSAAGVPASGFVKIDLLDDAKTNGGIRYKDNSTVTGVSFSSLTQGTVVFAASGDSSHDGGAVESLTSPTKVASIAYSGYGKGPDAQNASFLGLQQIAPGTLVALSGFGDHFVSSTDGGKTWTDVKMAGSTEPNIPQIWLSPDKGGVWHLFDDVGNVWQSPTPPSPTTVWTRTWQPEGATPVPSDLPPGACKYGFHQTYYNNDQQKAFFASSDGKTMMYGNGLHEAAAGVCRSTDGGKTFVPVAFPNPPGAEGKSVPYVIDFFDDLHGYAARANDLVAASAWAYTTADGGATWTPAKLPDAAVKDNAIAGGFHAPDGKTAYLVGFGKGGPLLYKSTDAGVTWTDTSAAVKRVLADQSGSNAIKLHTGFALDADHIWLGGDAGTLLYSATGGI